MRLSLFIYNNPTLFLYLCCVLENKEMEYQSMLQQSDSSIRDNGNIRQQQTYLLRKDSAVDQNVVVDSLVDVKADSISRVQLIVEVEDNRQEGILLPNNLERVDGVFGLLLICFTFFSLVGGINFLRENFSIFYSFKRNSDLQKDPNIRETFFLYFLILQTIILISIGLYAVLLDAYPDQPGASYPLLYILLFVLIIGIAFLLKLLFYRFIGYIFDIRETMKVYSRTYVIMTAVLGILFFIPILLLIYSNYWHLQIDIILLVILVIASVLLFFKVVAFFVREKFNFLFMIVYLCTAELIPYLFLGITLITLYRTDIFQVI